MTDYASRNYAQDPQLRPLGRDLRLLGWQLRGLVRQHAGDDLWEKIHRLRDLAEARIAGDAAAEAQMAKLIADCDVEELDEIMRAVGLFFDLANMSEDHHRVRVLQRRDAAGEDRESFAQARAALTDAGLSPEDIRERLSALRIEPVLTAHPTEAKRRSVRRAMARLRRDLVRLEEPGADRAGRRAQLARMRRDLASLWYTDPVSARKPEVMEELRRTLFAARTMWRITPRLMSEMRAAFPDQADALTPASRVFAFGNWVGGDRDGNPFVTAPVTRQTLAKLRRVAIKLHRREARRVRNRLTVSDARGGRPEALIARIAEARERFPGLARRLDRLHPDEWFVHWLNIIDARLSRSHALPDEQAHPMAYVNAADLAADIELMVTALREIDHGELLGGALLRWRDRVACFGLHLLTLDIRLNSKMIAEAVDEIMAGAGLGAGYLEKDHAQRIDALHAADRDTPSLRIDRAGLSQVTRDLVALFAMLSRLCAAGYREAIGPVIVSMTHDAADILAVRWLAKAAAIIDGAEPQPLAYAPLFETIHDLDIADGVLDRLLSDASYRAELEGLGNEQVAMVGYSDSAKDGGYVQANWSLHASQKRLAEGAQKHGVKLTVFHGRGGALGRGGGPAARAIRSLPPEAVGGRLRLTEQGEVISERYDDPAIALRHLEQLVWGTLTVGVEPSGPVDADDTAVAEALADASFAAYRGLIEHPHFGDYLRQCTALPLIESLRIGSRPSRRTASAQFEDLRAIPYTFAWNQVRMPINAFYGFGSAFAKLSSAQKQRVADRYEQWPWLRALVNNTELALARCDPAITRRYVGLADDAPAAQEIWQVLNQDFEQTRDAVLAIKGAPRLLDRVGWLRRSIAVRTPYLDILNLIQVELLGRARRAGDTTPADRHALRRSVQAIAAGLRNTG